MPELGVLFAGPVTPLRELADLRELNQWVGEMPGQQTPLAR
jgi:hypothetical protein